MVIRMVRWQRWLSSRGLFGDSQFRIIFSEIYCYIDVGRCIQFRIAKKARQAMYCYVRATNIAVEKQKVLQHPDSSFVAIGIHHAMCMSHCCLWPVRLYNIFPHYLIKGTIFETR